MSDVPTRPPGYLAFISSLVSALGGQALNAEEPFKALAMTLDVEEAVVRAVAEVEALGSGFLPDGRPKVLFEGQIFWKELKGRGIDPVQILVRDDVREKLGDVSDIVYPKWDRTKYLNGPGEWKRLERAKLINESAALCSASWGLFQIMGFHWASLDYESPAAFAAAMAAGYGGQFKALGAFLRVNGLVKPLRAKDWAAFARGYNGPGYAANAYDTKLAAAYSRWRKKLG